MRVELIINHIVQTILIISIFKSKNKIKSIFPFYIFAIVAEANDLISQVTMRVIQTNSINSNIYVLISSIIMIYQLQVWNTKKFTNFTYLASYIAVILIWSIENLILSNLFTFNIYNRIIIYLIIISHCLILLNPFSLTNYSRNKNEIIFTITAILVVKYSIYVVSETVWINSALLSTSFQVFIFNIIVFSNPIINLLLAKTVLWMPKRPDII